MNNDHYHLSSLEELKNNTLLLTTANEFLADEVFLVKAGNNISRAVEVLERDIISIKKEYPGKFVNDIDTDSILEKIDNIARKMLKPAKEVMDAHASGALGHDLDANYISIKKAVKDIYIKVRGSHTQNPGKGSAAYILDSFKEVSQSAGGLLISGAKILAGLIFVIGFAFAYLFITMEKDKVYINEIAASTALIEEKKGQLPVLEQEKQVLNGNKNAMKSGKEMTREEKVAALETEVSIKKINDAIDQLEAEIAVQEKKAADNQDKLDELRKKTFFERLLKH